MIGLARAVAIFACRAPVDMRKQYDSLAAIVIESMGKDPHDGALYLFVGRDRRRAKVLYFDGTGVCVLAKRLEKGRFASPWSTDAKAPLTMTTSELALFLEGSELIARSHSVRPRSIDVSICTGTHRSSRASDPSKEIASRSSQTTLTTSSRMAKKRSCSRSIRSATRRRCDWPRDFSKQRIDDSRSWC